MNDTAVSAVDIRIVEPMIAHAMAGESTEEQSAASGDEGESGEGVPLAKAFKEQEGAGQQGDRAFAVTDIHWRLAAPGGEGMRVHDFNMPRRVCLLQFPRSFSG